MASKERLGLLFAVQRRMNSILWSLCVLSVLIGLRTVWVPLSQILSRMGVARQRRQLMAVADALRPFEDALISGLFPSAPFWQKLKQLQKPWDSVTFQSLDQLRRAGGALLPTVRRLKDLALDQERTLAMAEARSSQALAQIGVAMGLVPLFAGFLYCFLPGVQSQSGLWGGATLGVILFSALGGVWLTVMVDAARWAGLGESERRWVLGSLCAGESFLALVRSGVPQDLAWEKICDSLMEGCPQLATDWRLFSKPDRTASTPERLFLEAGDSMKRAIRSSLDEGKPCLDRVEGILMKLQSEFKIEVEKELSLLPTRALKPLFLFVAPGILGLLGLGIWLAMMESMQAF